MSDIMMIEGLVGFGHLGADIEEDTFAPMTDESRPLYDPTIPGDEDVYAPLPDVFVPGDISPVGPGLEPVGPYEAAEPGMEPFPEAEYEGRPQLPAGPQDDGSFAQRQAQYGVDPTVVRAELEKILASRRKVIEEAVVERAKEEKKVEKLDTMVTQTYPTQIQQAVQAGEQQQAQWLAYQQQLAAAQRMEAARRAIELAKLQTVAGQMAKNTKAQIALSTLYQQAKSNGDTAVAQELSQGYEAIGVLTQQFKVAREKQQRLALMQKKQNTVTQQILAANRTLTSLRAALAKTTEVNRSRVQSAIDREKARIEKLKLMVADYKAMTTPAAPVEMDMPATLEGGLLGSLGLIEPYCSVVERTPGGWFTCNAIKQVNISGFGEDDGGNGAGVGGWGSSIKSGLRKAVEAVASAGKYVGEKALCPLGAQINKTISKAAASADSKKAEGEQKKLNGLGDAKETAKSIAKGTAYGTAVVVAADAVSKMCHSGSKDSKPPVVIAGHAFALPWWLVPVGVVVAGGGLALFLATRPAAPRAAAVQGFGRLPKRRRRRRASHKGLGCGSCY